MATKYDQSSATRPVSIRSHTSAFQVHFKHTSSALEMSSVNPLNISLKLTTVDLREAVVNHFLTLPESGDYSLRELFAALIKHLVRSQKRFSNEHPWLRKKESN